jgi:glyoxylase-like metal-dependent hydrolase (beta-lactamase superfamily II)
MAAAVPHGRRRSGLLSVLERLSSRLYRHVDTAAAYLITAGDRAIAIDAGDAGLLDHLESAGVRRIEWVLHTHHHRDGCQGDHRMAEHGARIAAPAVEADLLHRAESFWQTRPTRGVYDLHSDAFTVARNVPVARRLEDYDVVEWEDLRLLVLPTPGHTAGSVTFLCEVDGVRWAFSGDLVTAPGRPWTVHDLQWDYNEPSGLNVALQSVDVLRRRRPAMLGPAHGPVIADVPAALGDLTAGLTRLYALLGRGWGDAEPPPRPLATELQAERVSDHLITVSSAVACFHVLHRDGRALLFDYGFPSWDHVPGARSRFVEHSIDELRERFGIESIEVAIATHYHDDHVAGLPYLRREHGAQAWAHEAFADILESPGRRRLPCLPRGAVQVDRVLTDGETF